MEVQEIFTMIANYGFPCVVSLIMMYLVYKLNESHKEEMNKVTEALENNTKAIIELRGLLVNEQGSESSK